MTKFDYLVFLCRLLAPGGDDQTEAMTGEMRQVRNFWPELIQVAGESYMAAAVHQALVRKQLLEEVPEDVADYFQAVAALNGERNMALRRQAVEVCRILNHAGIEPVLLKGMANLVSGVYDDPSMRIMNDVDILAPEEKMDEAVELMRQNGYSAMEDKLPGRHHYPPMAHPQKKGVVELHTRVAAAYDTILSAEDMRDNSEIHKEDGARMRIPSPTFRVVHNIVHMQLSHGMNHPMYASQLLDLVHIATRYPEEVDWDFVHDRFVRGGRMGALKVYLNMMSRLFGPPSGVRVPPARARMFFALNLYKMAMRNNTIAKGWFLVNHYSIVLRRVTHSREARAAMARNLLRPGFYIQHLANIRGSMKGE